MTDEHSSQIPIDAHPDPVVAYAVGDDGARITAANEAFEATFEDLTAGMPATMIFEAFTVVRSTGDADPSALLSSDTAARIYLDGAGETGPYSASIIPVGEDTGRLVLTPLAASPDTAGTAGVGQVASVITHDLRNPLDVAKAHLRAARDTGDPEHFDAVADAHDRMERIIRDVLTLARGDEAVSVSEGVSIRTAAEDAWQSVDTAGAVLDMAETLPTTTADPDHVRRLFENLFRNSVEHGARGGPSSANGAVETPSPGPTAGVTVTVDALDDGFYVADDGPGIPAGTRDAVFDPGYTRADSGTGLGLAIVDEIVAAHDWELRLTTAENGGARFEVRFR